MNNRTKSILAHSAGIYLFFLMYNYYQEKISTSFYKNEKYNSVLFPIILHSLGGILASRICLNLKKEKAYLQDTNLFYRYFFYLF